MKKKFSLIIAIAITGCSSSADQYRQVSQSHDQRQKYTPSFAHRIDKNRQSDLSNLSIVELCEVYGYFSVKGESNASIVRQHIENRSIDVTSEDCVLGVDTGRDYYEKSVIETSKNLSRMASIEQAKFDYRAKMQASKRATEIANQERFVKAMQAIADKIEEQEWLRKENDRRYWEIRNAVRDELGRPWYN